MLDSELPEEFLALLDSVTDRRPKTVIDHIREHGFVTTEQLRDLYGYNHPPRGARDVRELGIPLETFFVTGSDGRRIGAYRFGDPTAQRSNRLSGRSALANTLKIALIERHGSRCNIYLEDFPEGELQIDHRIPFEIAGDADDSNDPDDYMLLCRSANRAKSWSCEHCENWRTRDLDTCGSCYWAFPENYTHVAMQQIRRLDLIWAGDDAGEYDRLAELADADNQNLPDFVKAVIRRHLAAMEG